MKNIRSSHETWKKGRILQKHLGKAAIIANIWHGKMEIICVLLRK